MRVALVLGTSAGGVGRHVHDLVGGLSGSGVEVLVACPADVGQHFAFVAAGAGARVLPLELADRPHPVRDARALRTLRAVTGAVDVVHAHGARAAALAGIAGVGGATPLVATLHNSTPEGLLTGLVHAALERVVARRADLVLAVSGDLVARMRTLGAADVDLAVVAAPPPPPVTKDRYAVRAELGVAPRTALLVSVGRLAPQKDLGVLLDAVTLLRAPGTWGADDLLAVVAGDGPLRGELQARIDTEDLPVRLLGHRADVPELLAAADLVVSSARWEGQPVWLQEALHAGAAVVATDAGGTAEVLGDAGIVVPAGDPQSLSRAIADVVRHGAVREDLRARALVRSAELPTAADALRAALAAYARVGAGRSDREERDDEEAPGVGGAHPERP